MDPAIEGTSAAAAEYMEIEGTSAAKDPPMDEISAAEHKHPISLPMEWLVKATSGAEYPAFKGTSAAAAEYPALTFEGTSAASVQSQSRIEGLLKGFQRSTIDEMSAAEYNRVFSREMFQLVKETLGAESIENGERTYWPKNSIFRVPDHIRSSRESNFEPKLVSIGPYYHGKENLERTQGLKFRCIQEILKMLGIAARRTNHPGLSIACDLTDDQSMYVTSNPERCRNIMDHMLDEKMEINQECFEQFMVSARNARDYYKEVVYYGDNRFVNMLFLDSCFIIRTILAFSQQTQSMSFLDVHIKDIRSDLLLLENQIPLFFIKEVYGWFLSNLKDKILPDFNTVLEPFICLDMPWRINHDAKSSEAVHLLDLYWRYSLSPKMKRDPSEQREYRSNSSEINFSNNELMVIANATELQQMAGIEFEKFKDEGHLDVIFSNGIIRMPRLKIDSRQITLLRNLIAFENCIIPSMRTISCYMKLMDALIDSANDVMLLQKCGVIYNTLQSHERAATFFNDIGNFCFTDDNENPFSSMYKDVQKYYDSRWHRRWASLRHNYFSSPWAGISVIAAVTLLILSALQTFYTVYGVYKLNN